MPRPLRGPCATLSSCPLLLFALRMSVVSIHGVAAFRLLRDKKLKVAATRSVIYSRGNEDGSCPPGASRVPDENCQSLANTELAENMTLKEFGGRNCARVAGTGCWCDVHSTVWSGENCPGEAPQPDEPPQYAICQKQSTKEVTTGMATLATTTTGDDFWTGMSTLGDFGLIRGPFDFPGFQISERRILYIAKNTTDGTFVAGSTNNVAYLQFLVMVKFNAGGGSIPSTGRYLQFQIQEPPKDAAQLLDWYRSGQFGHNARMYAFVKGSDFRNLDLTTPEPPPTPPNPTPTPAPIQGGDEKEIDLGTPTPDGDEEISWIDLLRSSATIVGACVALIAGIVCCCTSASHRKRMATSLVEEALSPDLADLPKVQGQGSYILSQTLLFYFVKREAILSATGPLPDFRELLRQDAVIPFYTSVTELFEQKKEFLVVSHRWETPDHPDPHGSQQGHIKEFLMGTGSEVEWIWFDYWSLPQGERNTSEQALFKATLKHMNALYLFSPALLLVDKQYRGRFWTCFEAFLSMQQVDADGDITSAVSKRAAGAQGKSRYHIIVTGASGSSQARKEAEIASLEACWGTCSVDQALSILSNNDILVTNLNDKTTQLEVLTNLPKQVRRAVASIRQGEMGCGGVGINPFAGGREDAMPNASWSGSEVPTGSTVTAGWSGNVETTLQSKSEAA